MKKVICISVDVVLKDTVKFSMFPVLIQGCTLVCSKATACHVDMPSLTQQFKELSAALILQRGWQTDST